MGKAKIKRRVIDKRIKEKFMVDDAYLNGMAKRCGWQATLVYLCLCRHASKEQESFPSVKLMQEKLGIGRNTVLKGIKNLEANNVISIEKERLSNGKWQNNVYILVDKSEWIGYQVLYKDMAPSPSQNTAESLLEQNQVPVEDTKETHSKETHSKDSGETPQGIEINELIELFRPVNPLISKHFANKTQRAAMERMLELKGRKEIETIIKALPQINAKAYWPKSTTPLELENNFGKYGALSQSDKNKGQSKIKIAIIN